MQKRPLSGKNANEVGILNNNYNYYNRQLNEYSNFIDYKLKILNIWSSLPVMNLYAVSYLVYISTLLSWGSLV